MKVEITPIQKQIEMLVTDGKGYNRTGHLLYCRIADRLGPDFVEDEATFLKETLFEMELMDHYQRGDTNMDWSDK